jgi:predicted RNA-binding Zn ribbon-like protein
MEVANSDVPRLALPQAPGADEHVALDFANSAVALPGGQYLDLLGTPEDANRWLTDHELAPAAAGLREVCAAQLRALREQVRALLASRVDNHPAPSGALQAVNDAMTRVPSTSVLRWDDTHGLHRAPVHPANRILDHALAALAGDAAELLTGPDADRLAACGSPPCNRYLLRTHGRRHWCSTRCGDRVRAARAYARRGRSQRGSTPPGPG